MFGEITDIQSIISIGIISKIMIYILLTTMFGKQEKRWVLIVISVAHFLIYHIGILIVFNNIFKGEFWYELFMPTMSSVLAIVTVLIISWSWKESFIKVLIAFLMVDALSCILIYLCIQICRTPIFIFLFILICLMIFYIVFYKILKKYREIKIQYSWIVGGFAGIAIANGWISNILYVFEEKTILSQPMKITGYIQILFTLFFILTESIIYYFVQKRKQRMLLRNKDQMESYYRQVARHIREIDETRILLEQGTKLLSGADAASGAPKPFGVSKASGAGVPGRQMEREEQEAVAAAPDSRAAMNPRQLQAYLAKLKSQYEALGEVFFCNDFAVDSVLRDYVVRCRKEGIKTDILFHEYQRGKVAAEDAAAILSRMLDYGIKAAKLPEDWKIQTAERHTVLQDKMAQTVISLHGASVKNQLIFSMTVTREGDRDANKNLLKIRIRKRSFNPWMRKYNGIVHVQREKTRLQMVVGLENGKKQ